MTAQREWFEKDYYKTLGIPKNASEKEITKAYRKLAKQLHPDANPGDKTAEDRFKEVSAAYDILGDPKKRKEYDEVRELSATGGFGGFGPGMGGAGGPGGPGGAGFKFEDLSDLFGGLFGRGGANGHGGGRGFHRGPARGDDLETELKLSFFDAVNGITTSVLLHGEAKCETCNGNGAKPGTAAKICPACSGSGVVNDNQGPFSFSRPCGTCHGAGRVIETPCTTCHGSGHVRKERNVKVRIPAGVKDGARIRLKGRGGPGLNGGPPGDLFVLVHVDGDSTFGRSGNNLTVRVPVTYPELALGATIEVPTLTSTVTVRIPRGTNAGKTLRVKGKGPNGQDLLVTLELADVAIDSPEERELLEKLQVLQEKKHVRQALLRKK